MAQFSFFFEDNETPFSNREKLGPRCPEYVNSIPSTGQGIHPCTHLPQLSSIPPFFTPGTAPPRTGALLAPLRCPSGQARPSAKCSAGQEGEWAGFHFRQLTLHLRVGCSTQLSVAAPVTVLACPSWISGGCWPSVGLRCCSRACAAVVNQGALRNRDAGS